MTADREVLREAVRDRIDQLLQLSMRRLNDSTDPETDDAHFRCRLEAGVLAAQAAYGLTMLAKYLDPSDCHIAASEMAELGMDAEVLVSWVGQELNRIEPESSEPIVDAVLAAEHTTWRDEWRVIHLWNNAACGSCWSTCATEEAARADAAQAVSEGTWGDVWIERRRVAATEWKRVD